MKKVIRAAVPVIALLLAAASEVQAQGIKRATPIVLAVRKAMPSVVSIKVERQGSWGRKEGSGTGVIVDERGYVVTNRHVISGAVRIQVMLQDKTEMPATLYVEDSKNDLAILKLPAGKTSYKPLAFGPASDLEVGETVIAIGHPYGYDNTVSTGIVSALGRAISMPTGERLYNLIQTNASINPGNSGGPLLNINGELIGINVALREGAQGIAFALNSDMVQTILSRHLSAYNLSRVSHGLVCHEKVYQPEGKERQRVVVDKVTPKSPAAQAGLQSGDVIIKLGGRSVANRFDVERAFWDFKAGEKVVAAVLREGQETEVALTLDRATGSQVASASEEPTKTTRTHSIQQAGDR